MKKEEKIQIQSKINYEQRVFIIQSSQSSKNNNTNRNFITNGSLLSRPKRQASHLNQSKGDISSSKSAIINRTEQHFKEMQQVILGENNNLKEHNNFLVAQINLMFQKERKHKKQLAIKRQKISQLQSINLHLTNQMHLLINNIVSEIKRIQNLLDGEKQQHYDEILIISQLDSPRKGLSYLGSETQSIITRDLYNLKSKINDFVLQSGPCTPSDDECFNYVQYKIRTDPKEKPNKNQQTITKENSVRNSGIDHEKQDSFQAYIPTKLLTNDEKQFRRFPPLRK